MDAQKATTEFRYVTAKSNATKRGRRLRRERDEALSHLSDDDTWNIKQSTHIPWISQLTASSKPHWGLVCLRTAYNDEEAWNRYKEHLIRCSQTGLWAYPGTDFVGKKWKIHLVEKDRESLDGASLENLCRYFHAKPPSSSISSSIVSGLRSDMFCFADARTISSSTTRPVIPTPKA